MWCFAAAPWRVDNRKEVTGVQSFERHIIHMKGLINVGAYILCKLSRRVSVQIFKEEFRVRGKYPVLIHKHLLDYCFDLSIGIFIYCTDSFDKPLFINRPDLVKDNPAGFILKINFHARRIIMRFRSHWRNYNSLQVFVHFLRRENQTRPCLFYFVANGWVKVHKIHIVLHVTTPSL